MATITITIPDGKLTRVLNAFCGQHGYQSVVDEKANLETKSAFAKRMIAQSIKDAVKAYEANVAQDAARVFALADAETIDIT